MIRELDEAGVGRLRNETFRRYASQYVAIARRFWDAVAECGLPVSEDEPLDLLGSEASRLAAQGVCVCNDAKSFHVNWLSPACEACRQGLESATFYVSLKCRRHCFFCFNPNQFDYERSVRHERDLPAELRRGAERGLRYSTIALSGGEPLLFKEEVYEFFRTVGELYPNAHTRLYTCGDLADEDCLKALRSVGLKEIRFSLKMDDGIRERCGILSKIGMAKRFVPVVMVEMPVFPGDLGQMKQLLLDLDGIGVDGVNLLEFCFPFNNADEFRKRGYRIKKRPYRVLYDYWYAGGLPIAGSEENCLALLEFALENGLGMGVHYCSLENKHTGQVYRQNSGSRDGEVRVMSNRDYFLKSAKVFGGDVARVRAALTAAGCKDFVTDAQWPYLEFPLRHVPQLKKTLPEVEIGVCYSIVEHRDGEACVRELRVDVTTPAEFDSRVDI